MKKFLAFFLCLCLMFTMSITAFASDTGSSTAGGTTTGGSTTGGSTTGGSTTGGTTTGGTTTGGTTTGGTTTGGSTTGGSTTGSGEVGGEVYELTFTDVDPDSVHAPAIAWAAAMGITKGVTEDNFAPARVCTRGEMVTFLWRAAGQPAPTSTSHNFTDVVEGKFYYNAMLWAVENGITNGTTATTFAPNAPCTRAQMCSFLYRAFQVTSSSAELTFGDVDANSVHAAAIAWAAAAGITTGTTVTTFAPNAGCTRAQMCTFLYRALA